MNEYININTVQRAKANTKFEFEKDLDNDSTFGKTMETLNNGVRVPLITCEKKHHKLIS